MVIDRLWKSLLLTSHRNYYTLLLMADFIFDISPIEIPRSRLKIVWMRIYRTWWQIWNRLTLSVSRNYYILFRLAYLHFIFDHSKDMFWGHTHIDCEYHVTDMYLRIFIWMTQLTLMSRVDFFRHSQHSPWSCSGLITDATIDDLIISINKPKIQWFKQNRIEYLSYR